MEIDKLKVEKDINNKKYVDIFVCNADLFVLLKKEFYFTVKWHYNLVVYCYDQSYSQGKKLFVEILFYRLDFPIALEVVKKCKN